MASISKFVDVGRSFASVEVVAESAAEARGRIESALRRLARERPAEAEYLSDWLAQGRPIKEEYPYSHSTS